MYHMYLGACFLMRCMWCFLMFWSFMLIYDVFGLLVFYIHNENAQKTNRKKLVVKTELSLMYGMENAIRNTEAESEL